MSKFPDEQIPLWLVVLATLVVFGSLTLMAYHAKNAELVCLERYSFSTCQNLLR